MSAPSKPTPCTTARATSFTKRCNNLQQALRLAYAGPKAAERLAHDGGVSVRSAASALAGHYPQAWGHFLRLIEKTPRILAHALDVEWADTLAVREEINETRRKLDEIERGLNAKDSFVAREKVQPARGMAAREIGRGGAAAARLAHNQKVGSANLPPASKSGAPVAGRRAQET